MPNAVTYPGVYVEELESGPQAIVPVATSIAAFVGRAPIGPVDLPMTVFSFGEFTRAYGGLKFHYPMSYAVQDFFANGGSQAVIARLFEPAEGDGVAQLKFPPAPPMLPDGWMLDANMAAGAPTLTIAAPPNSEGDPNIGMILTIAGDPTTQYLVTGYSPADPAKKTPATIAILPALASTFQKCTRLLFAYGASPSGWTVQSQSQGILTIAGGKGLPSLGQTFLGRDGNAYTAISQPIVKGASLDSLQVKLTLTPPPPVGAFNFADTAKISDPVPLPMPVGWEIDRFTQGTPPSTGSVTLINGSGAAMVGDTFTIGSAPDVYVVTGFTPAGKAETTLAFASLSGQPLDPSVFCHCCPPIFTRPPPTGMAIKAGPKIGATSFTLQRGAAATGVVDIGDTFTVNDDPTEYSVRYVDGTGTIYFLPEAETAFSGTNAITFFPPLTLVAANPGEWGNFLSAQADTKGITDSSAKQFQQYGILAEDLFNLTLTLKDPRGRVVATERHINLSIKATASGPPFPNRLDLYLVANSNLARVGSAGLPSIPPGNGATAQGIGGNDGNNLTAATYLGDPSLKTGLYLLKKTMIFNLLCIPPDQRFLPGVPDVDLDPMVRQAAADFCTERRAFYIVDPPSAWSRLAAQGQIAQIDPETLGITGEKNGMEVARNAAVYFPRLWEEDILMKSQLALFAPCGAIAGVMASTDVARGVWKAPAGIGAGIAGVQDFEVHLSDEENGQLNPLGINCLRNFPTIGPVVWGARTLRGADAFEDAYKYIPVRRLTLFIEESLYRGTQWAVFEPNDEALWSGLRLTATSFLAGLARQGAFYNYAVKCDATTTTPDDIELGIVNLLVQIAPVDPAEFVVIQIQQVAGGASPA